VVLLSAVHLIFAQTCGVVSTSKWTADRSAEK